MPLKTALAALALCVAPAAAAQNSGHVGKATSGISCPGCNLFQADLSYRDIGPASFNDARLRQSNLSLSTMANVDFSGADLSVANLFGARVNRSSFRNANLQSAVLVGAYLGRSNFAGADLSGAILSGADLSIATGLTQQQLDRACGDAATRLPSGLRIGRCN